MRGGLRSSEWELAWRVRMSLRLSRLQIGAPTLSIALEARRDQTEMLDGISMVWYALAEQRGAGRDPFL